MPIGTPFWSPTETDPKFPPLWPLQAFHNESILPLTRCQHCRRTGRGRPRRESQRRAARTARGPREDVARLVDDQSAAQCRAMSRLGCAAAADASPSLLALRLMRANARSLATYSREEWPAIPPGSKSVFPAGRNAFLPAFLPDWQTARLQLAGGMPVRPDEQHTPGSIEKPFLQAGLHSCHSCRRNALMLPPPQTTPGLAGGAPPAPWTPTLYPVSS